MLRTRPSHRHPTPGPWWPTSSALALTMLLSGLAWAAVPRASVRARLAPRAVPTVAGLPTIVVATPAPVPMTGTAASAINVVATCPAGATLVGGGSWLSRSNGTTPGNGLKLNGSLPSDASGTPAVSSTTTPQSWTTVAGFGGQADSGDQAQSFALCSTAQGPASSAVAVGPQVGSVTQGNPPLVSTASCAAGSSLIGGGALGTPASDPSFKPVASYPSNASGSSAGNAGLGATSWSAYGGAGAPDPSQKVAAYALCSTAPGFLPTSVARVDTLGPQAAGTSATATVTCPAGSRLLSGGAIIDFNGAQPEQGVHMRGSYPSDAAGNPVANTAANPNSWTGVVQAGGQDSPNTNLHVFGLCAQLPTYSAAVLADGPVDYWRLNDATSTVVDAIPGGHNGSYVSRFASPTLPLSTPGATTSDPGNTGKRFVTSVGVSVAGAPGAALTGDSTFETWFQIPDSLGPDSINGMVASASVASGTWGSLSWYAGTGSATIEYLGRSLLSATMAYPGASASQTWHHLALVLSGRTATLYVDGTVATRNGATTSAILSGPAFIGTDGGAVFGGALQDVAVYNKALTAAQIATHVAAAH